MCGICGYVGQVEAGLLERMLITLRHRGPDETGSFQAEGVGLGVQRLSIIDLAGGQQPLANEDGSLWIAFNGEIYNYRELRADLLAKGHRFRSASDTEVILHLYEEQGEGCLHRLRGMFAFAIWDSSRQRLFLARDRVGIKPLYYVERNGRLLFASEMKSLLAWEGCPREIDPTGLDLFLHFLYIPSPYTIFRGIRKLPPGHRLILQGGSCQVEPYWDLSFPRERPLREEEYRERCRQLLREAVACHLVSDVPLGAFLSGGMDSSTVVALMSQLSSGPVKTFSLGFEGERSYDEMDYARAVAERFGTDHHELRVKPEVIELLPQLVWHLDEPFADSSLILTYLVSRETQRHVKVALSGIGGDELFGGYPRYLGLKLFRYYAGVPAPLRCRWLPWLAGYLPESTGSRNLPGRLKRFLRAGALSPEEGYLRWISFAEVGPFSLAALPPPSSKAEAAQGLSASARDDLGPYGLHRAFLVDGPATEMLDKALYLDVKTYLSDDLLMMGDKMSLASSLELRVPLCDHLLLEFAASVPPELRIKGWRLKGLLKEVVSGMLPPEILGRGKQGFMLPLGRWLRGEMKGFVLDLLSPERIRSRGYFEPDRVRWFLDQHFSGRRNFADQLFALIVLELWHQAYGGSE